MFIINLTLKYVNYFPKPVSKFLNVFFFFSDHSALPFTLPYQPGCLSLYLFSSQYDPASSLSLLSPHVLPSTLAISLISQRGGGSGHLSWTCHFCSVILLVSGSSRSSGGGSRKQQVRVATIPFLRRGCE